MHKLYTFFLFLVALQSSISSVSACGPSFFAADAEHQQVTATSILSRLNQRGKTDSNSEPKKNAEHPSGMKSQKK